MENECDLTLLSIEGEAHFRGFLGTFNDLQRCKLNIKAGFWEHLQITGYFFILNTIEIKSFAFLYLVKVNVFPLDVQAVHDCLLLFKQLWTLFHWSDSLVFAIGVVRKNALPADIKECPLRSALLNLTLLL